MYVVSEFVEGLELIIQTHTDDVVGAAVDILAGIASALVATLFSGELTGVVAVEGDEVTDVEAQLVADVPGTTHTNAIAVAGERGVLLVTVGQTIVGALSATTHGKLLVDVPLDTCEELVSAMGELFLTVASHHSVLVVEEMILESST